MTDSSIETGTYQDPVDVLRRHGRSFNFARRFLTSAQANRAARLYTFCRYVDDLADEATDKVKAGKALQQIKLTLTERAEADSITADFLQLSAEIDLHVATALALIDGVLLDLQSVMFETEADLLRYAYQVAGTVGLMMCNVLDVTDSKALPFAIDLGMAMQLTNIARDIREDAENGRRYLPATWVESASPNDIIRADHDLKPLLVNSATRLIELAECYYSSAYLGFGYLPLRSRFAILVAARIYRQIGLKLRRNGFQVWNGRTVVSDTEKLIVASNAAVQFITTLSLHRRGQTHDSELHTTLTGFFGVDMRGR